MTEVLAILSPVLPIVALGLRAVWKLPDWVSKWIDVRDRWRGS